jgi:nitroimidazol reductase NimA-like FMN-containing flavoprotein (pyridoxamine 5'-phosphate oxidase superfamily)
VTKPLTPAGGVYTHSLPNAWEQDTRASMQVEVGQRGPTGAMICRVIDLVGLIELQRESFERAGPGLRASWPAETAMDAEELEVFLGAHRYCVLATASSKGRPLARPVAFLVLDTSVWLATVDGSRLRNLRRTPWVSIVISVGDAGAHQAVVIDGPVTTTADAPPSVREAWVARHGSEPEWADAWAEVRPDRLISYSAAKTS